MGNKEGIAPRRYDEKFKEGALRLVTEQGRPSKEVVAELGICIDTLRNWLKAAGEPSPGQADRQNREAKRALGLDGLNHMIKPTIPCSRWRVHQLMKRLNHSVRKKA